MEPKLELGKESKDAGEFSWVAVSIAEANVQAFKWMNAVVRSSLSL